MEHWQKKIGMFEYRGNPAFGSGFQPQMPATALYNMNEMNEVEHFRDCIILAI
jgi:hypothetical protein